ncbi:MAG: polyphenol oxidase family protein [bacterium]|nr:polyphenol oxidase family protein [bacterium]
MNDLLQFEHLRGINNISHGISNRHSEQDQSFDVQANQVHGNDYAWVDDASITLVENVDALLTRTSGIKLRVGVHDCVPIIVYDVVAHAGGVIHAGFRGTVSEILKVVLQEFDTVNTYVGIGPAIGACCYEDIDIKQENYMQAIESGVPMQNIEIMNICTKCNVDTYYSHRAGDNTNFGIYLELS